MLPTSANIARLNTRSVKAQGPGLPPKGAILHLELQIGITACWAAIPCCRTLPRIGLAFARRYVATPIARFVSLEVGAIDAL
jgi:hypothetical protein